MGWLHQVSRSLHDTDWDADTFPPPPSGLVRSQLLLSGRVEINVNLALGYLQVSWTSEHTRVLYITWQDGLCISRHACCSPAQDSSEDDDFCELAYFRTKISIRNTQQSAPELSLVGGASETEAGQPLDTFLISINCPHLYIQSSAVEQGGPLACAVCMHQVSAALSPAAILFWLNCKSVYSYWQNQRMQLNKEVHVY